MDASGTAMSVNNRGKKILLVDDDLALRTVLAEQLDLYDGFTTIQVGTAAEGLDRAKLAHYDAVLLDVGLPDMDGRELCKLMRRQGVRAPVIMLTAAKMMVEKGGKKKIRLTDKEASILKYLFRAGDRPVARDILLNEVWGYNAGVTTHTLETHIYRLRQKIEKDPTSAVILITDRGGYRLQP